MSAPARIGIRAVADALALRAWALRVLSPSSRDSAGAVPRATDPGWRVFLAAERCAAPLVGSFKSSSRSLPTMLVAEAMAESQRSLAVRRAASEIGAAAAGRGLRPVVLKGAVECVERGHVLFLTDLDLLVEPERFDDAREMLVALGYRPESEAPFGALGACNLNFVAPAGGVQVELHWTTRRDLEPLPRSTWTSIEPLRGAAGLYALAPNAHAWHVLTHGVVDHPDQQGRIRDALVLARALDRLSAADRDRLRVRASRHQLASALSRAISLAESIAGREAATEDTFGAAVAIAYSLRGSVASDLPRPLLRNAVIAAALGVGGGASGRAALRTTMRLHDVTESTAARLLQPLPTRAWTLGGQAARIALYAAHLAPAAPIVLRATIARLWQKVRQQRRPSRDARPPSVPTSTTDA